MEIINDSGEISFREVMNMETLFVEKNFFKKAKEKNVEMIFPW